MIFGRNRKNEQTGKLGKHGLLRHSIENPRRSVGCPRRGEAGVLSNGALCRGLDTVHSEHNFGFLFQKSSIHTPIV